MYAHSDKSISGKYKLFHGNMLTESNKTFIFFSSHKNTANIPRPSLFFCYQINSEMFLQFNWSMYGMGLARNVFSLKIIFQDIFLGCT